MPRPRIYSNDAERQAEHRARQKDRTQAQQSAYASLYDRVNRMHAAIQLAAAAGDRQAQHLLQSMPVETLEAVTTHFSQQGDTVDSAPPQPVLRGTPD